MTPAPCAPARTPAQAERERILERLRAARPALVDRLSVGPSGALVLPLPTGHSVEIGRMRRRGQARWVVVLPAGEGAVVREARSPAAVVRTVIAAWDDAAR